MPRVQRRAKLILEWDSNHLRMLRHGFGLYRMGRRGVIEFVHPHTQQRGEPAMKQAWRDLRDVLLPEWIALHPGTRPWAFWQFECTDRREDETETEYLARRGLLTDAERYALNAPDYQYKCPHLRIAD